MSGRLNQTMTSSNGTPVRFSASQPRRLQDEDALFPITNVKSVMALYPLIEKLHGGDHKNYAMNIHASTHISVIIILHHGHKDSAYEMIPPADNHFISHAVRFWLRQMV